MNEIIFSGEKIFFLCCSFLEKLLNVLLNCYYKIIEFKKKKLIEMEKIKKISIIIPVYNVEKYLKTCLDSVINQTYQNLEIILVDDGSTDNSGKICEEYKRADSRIIVIHKKNEGLSMARNNGLDIASGEYISFIDSDDYISKNMMETLYNRLLKTQSDMAVCSIQYVDDTGKNLCSKAKFNFNDIVLGQNEFWKIYSSAGHTECVVAWNKLYKRKILEQLYYPRGKTREDEFLLPYIIERCFRICSVSDRLIFYRQRNDSIMGNESQKSKLDYIEACFERVDFFVKRKNNFMIEDTMLRIIASVERYHLEADENYKILRSRIKSKIEEVFPLMYSNKGRAVLFLYKYNIFPYKIIHKILCMREKK